MRIVNLHINGFGIYNNMDLMDLSPGLNVFEGPNEAGKTTLMAFIRSILFGFTDRRSSENRYEPVNGGRHGGKIILESQEGLHYIIERSPGGAAGRVIVHLPEHTTAGETFLQGILGGMSRTLYRNVFAFGLEELQRLETLQNSEVSSYIYSAGMGVGAVSLVEIEKSLKVKTEQIFKSSGQRPKINVLLKKLENIQDKIQELQEIPHEYTRLEKELQEIEKSLKHDQNKLEEVRRLITRAEKALRARETFTRLKQLYADLLQLPEINNFPEAGVERWENLVEKVAEIDAAMEEKRRRLQELRELLGELCFDEELLQQGVEVEVLFEERRLFLENYNNLHNLQLAVRMTAQEVDRCLKLLGPGWSENQVQGFDCSIMVREQIRSYRKKFHALYDRVKEGKIKLMEAQRLREKYQVELDGVLREVREFRVPTSPTPEPLEVREKALIRVQLGQNCLKQLEHELNHLTDRQRDFDEQRIRLEREREQLGQSTPYRLLFFIVFLFSGIGVYLYFQERTIFILALILSLVSTVLGLYLYFFKNHTTKKQIINEELSLLQNKHAESEEKCQALQLDMVKELKEFRAAALSCMGKEHPEAEEITEAVQTLEQEKQSLFQRTLLKKSLASKKEELIRAGELVNRCEQDMSLVQENQNVLKNNWNKFLSSLGVTQELFPEGLEELLQVFEKAQAALDKKYKAINKLKNIELEIEKYLNRLNTVLISCGYSKVERENVGTSVLKLKEKLASARLNRQKEQAFSREINDLEQKLVNLEFRMEKLKQEQKRLLFAGGTDDPEEFRKRSVWNKERESLLSERIQLENTLLIIAGNEEKLLELKDDLIVRDSDETKELLVKLQLDYKELEKKISAEADWKGRLAQKKYDLENNDELAELMLTKETLQAELTQLAREWGVNQICQRLLSMARERYERERQPAVLKSASAYFENFTDGKYRRVLVPLGANHPEVEKADLTRLKTSELSRGTAEQLYLAMRFALVREYAGRVTFLPVIMDDILVNFDPERLQAAVHTICTLAQKHQVLFFTCHPHVARQLAGQNSEVKYINLGNYS